LITGKGGRPVARPFWLTKLLVRSRIARFLPVARRLTDGGTAYLRYYSDTVLAAPTEELLDPAYFPGPPGPDVIDLNLPAPRVETAVSPSRVSADRRGTPPLWGTTDLRNALADLFVRRDGRAVDPEAEVLITHGASGAYAATLDAFVNPGDRVVLFDPSSPLFTLGAKSRRANIRWVPTWTEEGRCRYLVNGFERAMRGAKLLVLSDPVNPTGACFRPEDLEHIAWIAAAYDVLVYLDESFIPFRYDGRVRSAAILPGAEKRVLTAGSVSQGWGLGSVRVGWVAGPKHLIRACTLTASLSAPYVPTVCQHLAAQAVGQPDTEFAPTLDQFRNRRQYVYDRLRTIGLEPEWPGGGYFVWAVVTGFRLPGQTGDRGPSPGRTFAERLLKEQKVLVGPGCIFGPSGGGHIRISFAADDGRLREGLARLAAFVTGLRNPTEDGSTSPSVDEVDTPAAERQPTDDAKPVFSRV
jgi:aspartate/methionine/tyrosine aminotransferase